MKSFSEAQALRREPFNDLLERRELVSMLLDEVP
jgi:hypothetical protein